MTTCTINSPSGVSNHNFPNTVKGDTFDGAVFTITRNSTAIDLTDAEIIMHLRLTPTGAIVDSFTTVGGGGLTIDADPTLGKFVFDSQIINLPAATYVYDIQIEFSNGVVKTYVGGKWTILQDVTHE
jgi:hypothetical protein